MSLHASKNLIKFEYDGKKVYMNTSHSRPLIFSRGGEQVDSAILDPENINNPELLGLLKKYRILIDSEEPTPTTYQAFNKLGKSDMGLYLLVTQNCNLACGYCLGNNNSYMNYKVMELDTAKKSIKLAAESMLPAGKLQIIYFGGEPLLNWKLVKECIKYVDTELKEQFNIDFRHHITSNLTFLPSDFFSVATRHKVTVLVDIDGIRETHNKLRPFRNGGGSYDRIIANVEKLIENDIYFELRATITNENVGRMKEIIKHHYQLNPSACAFPTLIPVDSEGNPLDPSIYPDPTHYSKVIKEVVDKHLFDLSSIHPCNVISARMLRGEYVVFGCGMILGNTAVIDHNGSVYPCIYLLGQDNFYLGNVLDRDNPLLQSNYFNKLYSKYESNLHVDQIEKCSDCAIRYYCGGGCSIRLLSLKGTDERTQTAKKYFHDINCSSAWASVEATIKYFEDKTKSGPLVIKKRQNQCKP